MMFLIYELIILIISTASFLDRVLLLQIFFAHQQTLIHSHKIKQLLIMLLECILMTQSYKYLNPMIKSEGDFAIVKHFLQHFQNFSILMIIIIHQNVFYTRQKEQYAKNQINYKTLHDVRNYLQSLEYFAIQGDKLSCKSDFSNQNENMSVQQNYNSENDNENKIGCYKNINIDENTVNEKITNKNKSETKSFKSEQNDNDNSTLNENTFKFIRQKIDYLYHLDLMCDLKYKTKLNLIPVKTLMESTVEILNILLQNKQFRFQILFQSDINSIQIDSTIFNYIVADTVEQLYDICNFEKIEIYILQFETCNNIIIKIPQSKDEIIDIFTCEILYKQLDCLGDRVRQKISLNHGQVSLDLELYTTNQNENKKISLESINPLNNNQDQEFQEKQTGQQNYPNISVKNKILRCESKFYIEETYNIGIQRLLQIDNTYNNRRKSKFLGQFNKESDVIKQSTQASQSSQSQYLENNEFQYFEQNGVVFVNVDDEENILKMNSRICSKQHIKLNKISDRKEFMFLLGRIYLDTDLGKTFKICVLMDNMLDRDQGYDVIDLANQFNLEIKLDITQILLSSTEDSETISKYEERNVKHFLTKPLNARKLREVLRNENVDL